MRKNMAAGRKRGIWACAEENPLSRAALAAAICSHFLWIKLLAKPCARLHVVDFPQQFFLAEKYGSIFGYIGGPAYPRFRTIFVDKIVCKVAGSS
jgi:hypothetical protein